MFKRALVRNIVQLQGSQQIHFQELDKKKTSSFSNVIHTDNLAQREARLFKGTVIDILNVELEKQIAGHNRVRRARFQARRESDSATAISAFLRYVLHNAISYALRKM